MKGKMKGTEEERENPSEGRYQTLSSAASRPHYAYECKFPFASLRAGIYLSRTRSRIQSRTVWYIHESPFLHVVSDFQFLFLLGHLRSCCYPPLANPSASFSLEFLSVRVSCHNYLLPSSRADTFVWDCTATTACCCYYFSINYVAVRE